jgi:uncharacterized membrane protein
MVGLVFLYLGLSFPLFLETASIAPEKFMNLESTASLFASALAGCLGLLSALPITAALVARYTTALELSPDNSRTKPSLEESPNVPPS